MKATEETKLAAKDAGIKSWWVKSEEKLIDELGLFDNEVANEEVDSESITVDSAEMVIEECEVKEAEELVLPTDVSRKHMDFSIKCRGEHSPYYKYRNLL